MNLFLCLVAGGETVDEAFMASAAVGVSGGGEV